MTDRYAVFGHPVAHSKSPQIHAAFGRQEGISLDYRSIDLAPDAFLAGLEAFASEGGVGANVTSPHKEAAFSVCTTLTARARRAGSVNTLLRKGDRWHGDTTDGIGLVRDLTDRHSLDLRGRRVLLLGAGGSARSVAPALLDAGITELVVVNRTPERADELIDAMGEPGRALSRYWED
uniref:shikimate dehydrogenase n=1 Tax=Stenotrophomonas indicatrix TaxID=2045451 RepID=UPI002FD8CAFE